MFGRATIRLGIGPHSSFTYCRAAQLQRGADNKRSHILEFIFNNEIIESKRSVARSLCDSAGYC